MSVRIATYNVNNLFERARVLELKGFSERAAEILADIQKLNELLEKESYAEPIKTEIKTLLDKYKFHEPRKNPYFRINEIRERLYKVPRQNATGVNVIAKGRADWVGWVELLRAETNEIATENTARVMAVVKADIYCLVEVEDRQTLHRFNQNVLGKFQKPFAQNLLVDGNDDRGIDLAVLSKYEIRSLRSHIHDEYKSGNQRFKVFSRDCAEYEIVLPDGKSLWLLCNHLKSKGYGSPASSNKKRARQADRICEILKRFDLKNDFVIVAGDFNDTPESEPLKKLTLETADLFDVLSSDLIGDAPRWTYHSSKDQIDYLLASKPLFDKLKAVGIERRGIFSKTNFGGAFPHFPEVTDSTTQASDHAAVWAEFDI
jgi:endonuclease/exonuclease/phosphatase family metal-dependent hydrolase